MPTIIYIIFPMFLIFQDNYLESASKTLKYVGEQLSFTIGSFFLNPTTSIEKTLKLNYLKAMKPPSRDR